MRNTVLMLENDELQETQVFQSRTIHNLSASLFEFMNNFREFQSDNNNSIQSFTAFENEISIYDEANVLMKIFSSMNNIVGQNKDLKGKYNQPT